MSISKFWEVGKFGKHASAVPTPLGNKGDRSAQAVQDEASLASAATRADFPTAPRPQVGNAHGSHSIAATIRPPEVRMTAITREWLCWDDYSDKSEREATFQRKYSRMCVLQDLLISTAAVYEYYVLSVGLL